MAELIAPLDALSRRDHFTAEDDLVFCSTVGEHLNHHPLRRRYYAALERAGLRRLRLHDLRHVFGSVAVRAFPLSDVQAMLGHAHITTTMRYVHHRPGADDAARLSSAFAGEAVSPLVSPNGDTERQLGETQRHESPANARVATTSGTLPSRFDPDRRLRLKTPRQTGLAQAPARHLAARLLKAVPAGGVSFLTAACDDKRQQLAQRAEGLGPLTGGHALSALPPRPGDVGLSR